jgi:hypothetical protein
LVQPWTPIPHGFVRVFDHEPKYYPNDDEQSLGQSHVQPELDHVCQINLNQFHLFLAER